MWHTRGGHIECTLEVATKVTTAPVPTKPVPTNPVAHEGCPLRVFAKGILPVPTRPVPLNFWFRNCKNNTKINGHHNTTGASFRVSEIIVGTTAVGPTSGLPCGRKN